jgi:hypothetical protein
MVVFGDIVLGCWDSSASAETIIADSGGRPGAISANVNIFAIVTK